MVPTRGVPPSATARPAVLVAATHSGAGKTTATGVVLRALRRRGLEAQPFKLGPDFIDAGYHTEVAGRPTINLDIWMMGERGVRDGFRRWSNGVDISVVEAMGGLFDGENGSEWGSAAHVAKLLGVPVVVVLDVWGMTRTVGAILEGLRAFDPHVNIAGCILNRVGSATHTRMITDALPARLRPLVLGAIGDHPGLKIPERHLGLVTVEENQTTSVHRDEAYERAGDLIDIEQLVRITGVRERVSSTRPTMERARAPRARIAVARDPAFCFYYEENLLLLCDAGFEVVPFRPTVDPRLPSDVDAVYLGGGYPESFAAGLAANTTLASELRSRTADGMPLYAECGGLMYLGRSLTGFDGVRHKMSGVLPLDVVMDPEHLAINYVEVRTRAASPLGKAGTTVRGQEFHQSRIVHADIEPTLYDMTTTSGQNRREGYLRHNIVASYVHLHFASNRDVVKHLLRASIDAAPVTSRRDRPPTAGRRLS